MLKVITNVYVYSLHSEVSQCKAISCGTLQFTSFVYVTILWEPAVE